MKLHLLHTMLLLATSLTSLPSLAQSAYRCGDSYSQSPCPGGTVVDINDKRSQAQKAQTDAATQRDARQAQAMEKARLRKEANTHKVDEIAPKATAAQPGKSKAHAKKKNHEPAYFTAHEAGSKKPVKKKTAVKGNTAEEAPPASKP